MSNLFSSSLPTPVEKHVSVEEITPGYEFLENGGYDVSLIGNTDPPQILETIKGSAYEGLESVRSNNPNLPSYLPSGYEFYGAEMNNPATQQPVASNVVHLKTKDNKNFRLYLSGNTHIVNPAFQNKFCTTLLGLNEEQTIHINMGSMILHNAIELTIGSLISAIVNSKAKVITEAVSNCGCMESYMWLFGHERYISPYGALMFIGVVKIIETNPAYKSHFKYIFSRAKEIGLLNDEDIELLLTTQRSLMFTKDGKLEI